MVLRLDKMLAHCRYGSRKEVKQLIRKGEVIVNGEIVYNDDLKVDSDKDEVIVFDEPTAGLDPNGRNQIIEIIKDYRNNFQATVVIISHSMEDMALLADKLLFMNIQLYVFLFVLLLCL